MGEQREGVGRAGFGVVMELFLYLAGVNSSTLLFSPLSSLRLAGSLAGGLLFPLGAIIKETTETTETTETAETMETIETIETTEKMEITETAETTEII